MPDFLTHPVGNTVDEMLDFCQKALELLAEMKREDDENPFI